MSGMKINYEKSEVYGDNWFGDTTLKVEFWQLFQICSDPEVEVSNVWQNGQWLLNFRRTLDDFLLQECNRLPMLLRRIQLSSGRDEVVWELEKSGRYTIRYLYRLLSFGGIKCSSQ